MFVIVGAGIVTLGAWIGMQEPSNGWRDLVSTWLMVVGIVCVIFG